MFFLRKIIFHFLPKEKISHFQEKNTIFPENTGKIMFRGNLFEKTIFSEHSKKISYSHVLFWERSSFIFRPRGKIIFSGKSNIVFPDSTRKTIFQSNFRKTIFSGRPEKENMVFRAVLAVARGKIFCLIHCCPNRCYMLWKNVFKQCYIYELSITDDASPFLWINRNGCITTFLKLLEFFYLFINFNFSVFPFHSFPAFYEALKL